MIKQKMFPPPDANMTCKETYVKLVLKTLLLKNIGKETRYNMGNSDGPTNLKRVKISIV